MMKLKSLHLKDALRLLGDGEEHHLKVWKLSTGELIDYPRARMAGAHKRRGIVRVYLPQSALIRAFREVALVEIDDLTIYL